jgi:hypothetical protein
MSGVELRGKPVHAGAAPATVSGECLSICVTGVPEPWEGRTGALTREPGDLPRHITSPGGVSGEGRPNAVGADRAAVRAHLSEASP